MKLNDILLELQFQPVPYEFIEKTFYKMRASFEIEGVEYQIHADHNEEFEWEDGRVTPECYSLAFSMIGPNGVPHYDMTNGGHQYQVLGTVVACVRAYLKEMGGFCVNMTGDTPARIGVYTKMIRRIVPDWNVVLFREAEIFAAKPRTSAAEILSNPPYA